MEAGGVWRKVALTLGGAAAVAVVLYQLRKQQEKAKSSSAPSQAKAEERSEAKKLEQTPAPAAAPAPKAAAAAGSIEAQKAAALGAASRAWAPDFDAPLEQDIERRLRARFNPTYLELVNMGSCDALKLGVNMVSEAFRGQSRINRQRDVQSVCKPDLDSGRIHALSLQLKTPEEYQKVTEKQGGEAKNDEPSKSTDDKGDANRPAPAKAEAKADAKPVGAAGAAPQAEKRRDPYSGKVFTLPELEAHYKGQYNTQEIYKYWREECKPWVDRNNYNKIRSNNNNNNRSRGGANKK